MKTVTIEGLLQWAFCQELCKVGAGSGDGLTAVASSNWEVTRDMAVLGTIIDKSPNLYGVVPGFIEDGEPHPDAVKVGEAVRALAGIGIDLPEGWMPFPEFEDPYGLIAGEVERVADEVRIKGDLLSGRHLVALVTRAAILGHGPDWRCDQPSFLVVSAHGKPRWFVKKKARDAFNRIYEFEGNGYDSKRCKPVRGAYRKYELERMLRGDILSRLDWQLWQDALQQLANQLDGNLGAHRLMPFFPNRAPWGGYKKMADEAHVVENAI
ncbi:hypothetical protein [Rhizobium sp. SSA_523]|uniref:hypothetical protein n=1 Tax=Rhizobium sp. SSA_523 TaxID=2952477 RepID=UPI0020903EAE|nr:hypothetical protein [Rhizobium sp. SSA_523]MCO5734113.1 hypothetical protein [Rhizobium sp. SSA_523]WKC24750.1 hypothetical protein QTJ18_12040 [Rhizobium sp. SSA_523]